MGTKQDLHIERVPTDTLLPNPANPRRISYVEPFELPEPVEEEIAAMREQFERELEA